MKSLFIGLALGTAPIFGLLGVFYLVGRLLFAVFPNFSGGPPFGAGDALFFGGMTTAIVFCLGCVVYLAWMLGEQIRGQSQGR